MKNMIVLFSAFILSFSGKAWSASLEQELEAMKKAGLVVRMGELTGAGGKLSLSRVHSFIHPEGLIRKTDCSVIRVRSGQQSADPKVSDVVGLKIGYEEVAVSELMGVVTSE